MLHIFCLLVLVSVRTKPYTTNGPIKSGTGPDNDTECPDILENNIIKHVYTG